MKKLTALTLAVFTAACAASAFAAPASDGVKDPETGITLHPPKHEANAAPGSKQEKFADEVKSAMKRVATATKKVVHRADEALHNLAHNNKA